MSDIALDPTTRTLSIGLLDFHYTEADFIRPEQYDAHHRVWHGRVPKAFVVTVFGQVQAIVFQDYYTFSEQDALDAAADSGNLDAMMITPEELPDYQVGTDGEGYPEYEGIIHLGNASEPFDSENLEVYAIPARIFEADPVIQQAMKDNPDPSEE